MIRGILQKSIIACTALVAGLSMFGAQAQAQNKCDLRMTPVYSTWVIRYDPFTGNEPVGEFDIEFTNTGNTPCVGRLTVVSENNFRLLESRTGAPGIPYTLRDVSNSNDITPGTSGNLTGKATQIHQNSTDIGRVRFSVTPPANVSAGVYTQSVRMRFIMPNGDIHAETTVQLEFRVETSLVIGLAGEFRRVNGMATLDLGQLTQNGIVPLNAKVYVRASSGYQVTVTSQNGGYLRHDQPQWQIPYGLSVGGQVINMSAPRVLNNNGTVARVDDYPLQISVNEIEGKRAGRYSDVLNFTVTAI